MVQYGRTTLQVIVIIVVYTTILKNVKEIKRSTHILEEYTYSQNEQPRYEPKLRSMMPFDANFAT